jgi:hypothetical protein
MWGNEVKQRPDFRCRELPYSQIELANVPQVFGNLLRAELKRCGIGDDFGLQIWHVEELENLFELIPRDEFVPIIESKSSGPDPPLCSG